MKTINFKNSFFSGLKIYKDIFSTNELISLSNEKHLKLVVMQIGRRISVLSFLTTNVTNRIRYIHNFIILLIKLRKNHGDMFVIKYLKASQLAVQRKLAGDPFVSLREIEPDLPLPRLSKSGLPMVIPLRDRLGILRKSLSVIRFWLSILSLYRVLKAVPKSKLNTITDPFAGDYQSIRDFQSFIFFYGKRLLASFNISYDSSKLAPYIILPINKASPSHRVSFHGMFNDARVLLCSYGVNSPYEEVRSAMFSYLKLVKAKTFAKLIHSLAIERPLVQGPSTLKENCQFHIGSLAFKEEAAGKLRVFAMVDVITQSILKPLHDWLFNIFKQIPNDASLDQAKGFRLAQELGQKFGKSYAFDLSSATDRLPANVQACLLDCLFGNSLGTYWLAFLTKRPYFIPNGKKYGILEEKVNYTVGQPMGALSSWAMLNLTHHFMIQFCFFKARGSKGTWYKDYVILGDDLVLFEQDIALEYLDLCKGLGIEINLTKSIISEKSPVIEFAKRTSIDNHDVSPLSFKEMINSNNFFGRVGLATRLVERKWGKDLVKIFKYSSMESYRNIRLSYPIIAYLSYLVRGRVLQMEHLISLLVKWDKPLTYFGASIQSFDKQKGWELLKKCFHGGILTVDMKNLWFAAKNEKAYKIALYSEAAKIFNSFNSQEYMEAKAGEFARLMSTRVNSDNGELKFYTNLEDYVIPVKMVYLPFIQRVVLPKVARFSGHFMFANFPGYLESQAFQNQFTLEQLIELVALMKAIKMDVEFYKSKPERRQEIDNPLKILEFIRNSAKVRVAQEVKHNPMIMNFPKNIFPMHLLQNKPK